MGVYKYIKEIWKKPQKNLGDLYKERLIEWSKQPSTVRIERPTRLDRARNLGYKPKTGFILVRQRVKKGGRQRPKFKAGRRSKHRRRKKIVHKNYQQIAEERANRKFKNCEVLNSYWVGNTGKISFYEVIMVDRNNPQVLADKNLRNLAKKKGRTFRGLTSSGRK
jgi:large subunit ribosomal protein L15e